MIDLVYLLGTGSKWDNNELRYSLRSIELCFTNVGQVWIIGEVPNWLRNVRHVPYREVPNQTALNIAGKICFAAKQKELTTEFVLMSDDYFMLDQMNAETIPVYYQGSLQQHIYQLPRSNFYKTVLKNTVEYLEKNNRATMDYNVHAPMIMNIAMVPAAIPLGSKPIASKSVYGNFCNAIYYESAFAKEYINDVKLRAPMNYSEIIDKINGWKFFSTGNRVLNADMKKLLNDLYPQKSRFEI